MSADKVSGSQEEPLSRPFGEIISTDIWTYLHSVQATRYSRVFMWLLTWPGGGPQPDGWWHWNIWTLSDELKHSNIGYTLKIPTKSSQWRVWSLTLELNHNNDNSLEFCFNYQTSNQYIQSRSFSLFALYFAIFPRPSCWVEFCPPVFFLCWRPSVVVAVGENDVESNHHQVLTPSTRQQRQKYDCCHFLPGCERKAIQRRYPSCLVIWLIVYFTLQVIFALWGGLGGDLCTPVEADSKRKKKILYIIRHRPFSIPHEM